MYAYILINFIRVEFFWSQHRVGFPTEQTYRAIIIIPVTGHISWWIKQNFIRATGYTPNFESTDL